MPTKNTICPHCGRSDFNTPNGFRLHKIDCRKTPDGAYRVAQTRISNAIRELASAQVYARRGECAEWIIRSLEEQANTLRSLRIATDQYKGA